ncbi:hypothetical protein C8F04DRAFT_1406231 [Mycena alexandri]|uniref:Uncharacterized protein n=1 Tax=Mycena alexandri TaxID=1745969 RepID=A0AAD6WLR8_9AGAR|nr:hypothetical protein C8F04DRAFT_1406231 [Mycena alexandri]
MSASAGPSSESAFVSEPRDYWKDLRQISEFHEVWRLLDADYRNGLTGEAIRNIILAYSPQLSASVKRNKKHLHKPDFPRELALFHEGLRLPALMVDSNHRHPRRAHHLLGAWPPQSRVSPVQTLPALFEVPLSPAELKQLRENAEREERIARRKAALNALAKAKRDADAAEAAARRIAIELGPSDDDTPLQKVPLPKGKSTKRKPSGSPVGSAPPEVKRSREVKPKVEKAKVEPDANSANAAASGSKSKSKQSKGPSKISIPATDGTEVEVALVGRQAAPVKDSADRVLHDGGIQWENARKVAISNGQALPIVHCEEVYQRRQGKPTNKKVLNDILMLLPVAEREQLPEDEMGNKIVDHEVIQRVMKLRPPTNGPKCIPCQRAGSQCFTQGFPLGCEACTRTHAAGGCNLSLSGEVQDNLAAQLTSYAFSGSEHWYKEVETLNRSQEILDTMTRSLVLHHTSCFPAATSRRTSFLERFKDRHNMEHTLFIALIQGLTCRTKITRMYVWHYYTGEFFEKPLPEFGSAYEFYQALDNAGAAIPGYFLLPPETSSGTVEWVPLKIALTWDLPTRVLSWDLIPSRIRRRLRREALVQQGEPLPEDSDSEMPAPDDGTLPEPPVPARGLFRKVLEGGLNVFDLQAIESSEARVEWEEQMADADGEDDYEEENAEDIDNSDEDSSDHDSLPPVRPSRKSLGKRRQLD